MLYGDDGGIATSFTGKKLQDGVYALFWNETEGTVPLTMRKVAPSNPGSKAR